MPRFLIDEDPLYVLPTLAKALDDLNAAIVMQKAHLWMLSKADQEHEGLYWFYHTHDQWLQELPFWSLSTIKRILKDLKEKNLLLSEQINASTSFDDKRCFYTIDYKALEAITEKIEPIGTTNLQRLRNDRLKLTSSKGPRSGQTEPIDKVNLTHSNGSKTTTDEVNLTPSPYKDLIKQGNEATTIAAAKLLNPDVVVFLEERGISGKPLREIAENYPLARIQEAVGHLDRASLQKVITNPAGWLVSCLRGEYTPPLPSPETTKALRAGKEQKERRMLTAQGVELAREVQGCIDSMDDRRFRELSQQVIQNSTDSLRETLIACPTRENWTLCEKVFMRTKYS